MIFALVRPRTKASRLCGVKISAQSGCTFGAEPICPREELNLNLSLRRAASYPLNDEGIILQL